MEEGLHQKNMTKFWSEKWEKGSTGWKNFEKSLPFATNVGETLSAFGLIPKTKEECGHYDVVNAIKGWKVFVPLCGDSAALRFFHDCGCFVVGVELVAEAVDNLIQQHFKGTTIKKLPENPNCGGAVEYIIDGRSRVFRGDAFPVMEMLLQEGVEFDFIYDRAALVALPSDLRLKYVSLCGRLMPRPGAVAFVETVIRRKANTSVGPPYMISPDEIQEKLYPAPQFDFLVTRPANPSHVEGTEGPGHGFCHTAVLRKEASS